MMFRCFGFRILTACVLGLMLTFMGGCGALFTPTGQPTVITTAGVYAGSYIATTEQLKGNPAAAATVNAVATAVKAANQSPPDVAALKALAAREATKGPYGFLIVPLINAALDQAAQQASQQTPTVQQTALRAMTNDALQGVIDASAAAMAGTTTKPAG